MKKEELSNNEFLKPFKSGDELNGFLKELQKRGIAKMLEGESEISIPIRNWGIIRNQFLTIYEKRGRL
ncbi:hypothetical protein Q4603_17850 [Zobellia galactanivorans]|nr:MULTISPECIES: hypothetical protein [Zobellia]MDO6810492.1 hypothetical protein [Zobellia galactanivorans]OWW26160.1 hypothetical protein B4Q04_00305 [Zobellia sp. OII3]